MSEMIPPTPPVPPPMLTVDEAKEKASAFQKDLEALLDRYRPHAFFGVLVFQTSQMHDIWYASEIRGCLRCVAMTLARIITRRLPVEYLDMFTRMLAGFNAENIAAVQDPAIADLEKLPVALDAEGKPYKN
jgi:hypothetical protein